jgi:hypothetical protein
LVSNAGPLSNITTVSGESPAVRAILRVFNVHRHQAPGAGKLRRGHARQRIRHRQFELIDGE